jgi:hypothetical protein
MKEECKDLGPNCGEDDLISDIENSPVAEFIVGHISEGIAIAASAACLAASVGDGEATGPLCVILATGGLSSRIIQRGINNTAVGEDLFDVLFTASTLGMGSVLDSALATLPDELMIQIVKVGLQIRYALPEIFNELVNSLEDQDAHPS